MQIYCLPLELIAFAIHPGDTQSTTTICLDVKSKVLYITSQSNYDFADVTPDKVRDIIDFLITASKEHRAGHWKLKKCMADFWLTHCALADKQEQTSSLRVEQKIDEIYSTLYENLWKKFLAKQYSEATLLKLRRMFLQVLVIKDRDISYGKAMEKTGFHGESRIIRFLFIRDYPTIHLAKTGTFFFLLPNQDLSDEIQDNAREWFKEKISREDFAMGSSQGTCLGCCGCLDEFSIARGDAGNNPDQWRDPLTLRGMQGNTRVGQLSDRGHAIFVAFKYLARSTD